MARLKRRPLLAFVLNGLMMGLGHFYLGRARRGLSFYFSIASLQLGLFLMVFFAPPSAKLAAFKLGLALLALAQVLGMLDALILARRLGTGVFEKRWFNRVWVYLAYSFLGLLLLVSLAMIERGNLVNIYRVTSHSMTPALLHKDIVLVNQQFNCVSCSHALLIGDIVVFGIDASVSVKRIVGLPGDELLIEDHVLSVNGTQVQGKQVDVDDVAELDRFQKNGDVFEERLGAHVYLALFEDLRGSSMERVQVPPGSVFVLGDNRGGSKDSREYGFISFENIRGRVEQVWFTRDRPLGTRAERAGLSFPSSVSPR